MEEQYKRYRTPKYVLGTHGLQNVGIPHESSACSTYIGTVIMCTLYLLAIPSNQHFTKGYVISDQGKGESNWRVAQ